MATALGENFSIPEQIIFEIFSWLPVKSLYRFKCVSGFCSSLISNQYFREIHQSHSSTHGHDHKSTKFLALCRGKFYTVELGQTIKASSFHVEKLDRVSYSKSTYAKGLLCLYSPCLFHQRAIILNPSTRETRFLPCLSVADLAEINHLTCCSYSLGFDTDKRRHKILMTLYNGRNKPTRNWIFTLGISCETWREIKSIPNIEPLLLEGVHIDGVIYFFSCHHTNTIEVCIVAFNVRTEEFRIISSLWDDHIHWGQCFTDYQLVEVDGKLAAIDYSSGWRGVIEAVVWILQTTPDQTEEWVHRKLVSKKEEEFCISSSINNGEIIVFVNNSGLSNLIMLYDLKKKWWRKINEILGLDRKKDKIIGIYSYDEDSLHSL